VTDQKKRGRPEPGSMVAPSFAGKTQVLDFGEGKNKSKEIDMAIHADMLLRLSLNVILAVGSRFFNEEVG